MKSSKGMTYDSQEHYNACTEIVVLKAEIDSLVALVISKEKMGLDACEEIDAQQIIIDELVGTLESIRRCDYDQDDIHRCRHMATDALARHEEVTDDT